LGYNGAMPPDRPLIEDWNDLRIVLAVADHGTLSGAAAALKISHPTLTRRLKRVEQRIGLTLFERTAQGLRPTEAGAEMRALAEGWRSDIGDLERRLAARDRRPAGLVRITAPDAVAEYILPDILARFRREHPDIVVELNVSSAVLSLAQWEADIAVRITDQPGPSLVGRRIGTVGMAVYAENRLAASLPRGREPWIGYDGALACHKPGLWLADNVAADQIAFRSNTLLGIIRAARSGLGLAILPCFVGDGDPHLMRLRGPLPELDVSLWLLADRTVAHVPRVRTALDGLARGLKAARERLSGVVVAQPQPAMALDR
jgi:DNA-binding transcriptional LysR family regulator